MPLPSTTFPFDQSVAWSPNPDWISRSNLQAFMDRYGIPSLDALQERSVSQPEWFWDAVLKDLDIRFERPYSSVMDLSKGVEFPVWCVNGRMNIIHNLLDKWQEDPDTRLRPAIIQESEDGSVDTLTYAELNDAVCRCANALHSLGLVKGDAVGLYMPMTVELAVAFLAIIKIGGVILPLFSGYGPQAIATRLNDAGAKALFTADGFMRRGKQIPMKETADEALTMAPTVRHVIVQDATGRDGTPMTSGRDVWWSAFVSGHGAVAPTASTSAEDTLMIIYTSGTTGRPKGAVHTHCGFPVKSAQDMRQAMDVKPGDVVYWMTDMGWMMGPWLVFGTLALGATMVFYDGAPDVPDAGRVWQSVASHGVTHLGLSPVLVRALMPHGTEPIRSRDVSSLRAIASTGSPWDPDSWLWVFRNVLDSRKPILNYSGGTEISGGILCGNFFRPLKPCSFSGPVPGMAADVVDETGSSIRGAVGELVIRGPWIGMTRGFWNDNPRYIESYWKTFPGVWLHGDFAAVDDDGLWFILGRSDDTIKVAGKRLGPAEAEAILNAHPAVAESAAIGIPDDVKGEALGVYCVLNPGSDPTTDLRNALSAAIAAELGKPLRPAFVRFTTQLPKTRNAKVMRRLVRAAYLGADPGDVSSLEDPTALDAIRSAS
ncbi:MAG: AMP-binding protein [Rhodothermales bacterium]